MSPRLLSLQLPTRHSIWHVNTSQKKYIYIHIYILSVNSLKSVFSPHLPGANVRVAAGPVPVALHRFGVQRCDNSEIFTHPVQQVTGNPQMVRHVDALAGAHLELPLQAKRRRSELNVPSSYGTFTDRSRDFKSTWDGITSALLPQILTPAYRHAL